MTKSPEFVFKEGPNVFTPKDLVELERPGEGVPNAAGDLVLVSMSKYSFSDAKDNKSIFVAPLESHAPPLQIPLTAGGEALWLDDRTIAQVLDDAEKKIRNIYALTIKYNVQGNADGTILSVPDRPILVGSLPTKSASNFRFRGNGYLVFSDNVYADGDLWTVNEQDEKWENRGNSALVYDVTYERHWDTWIGPKSSSLFSVHLFMDSSNKWRLGSKFVNLLRGTGHNCPVEPFGGTDDFDITKHLVVYTTLDPALPKAWHTKQDIYVVNIEGGKPGLLTSGKQGATHNPVFSKKGSKIAWLELDDDGYEADRAKIVIYDLDVDVRYTLTQDWDRSPIGLSFSLDDEFIYLVAGETARYKVFVLPVPPTPSESTTNPKLPPKYRTPVALTHTASASALHVLPGGRLIFTKSSYTSPNDVYIIRGVESLQDKIRNSDHLVALKGQEERVTHFAAASLKGKDLSEGEEFWFKGAQGKDVHGWVLKPKGRRAGTKIWPVVLLIHGGPQGAWEDKWSTRWNPNVFAQQGYFVVALNPTGSTTFGQEFTDAITEDWGGKPFTDMQAGWKYILDTYPEVDPDRAVAAGASWGGYAINWIQGHPEFAFGFKALVCHDGVFDTTFNGYSTEELFFWNHEWGGRPWEAKARAVSEKYNPANFVHKWSTPQLVIHGSKDYRLAETEGIGAFHALQERGIPSRLVIFPDENHWVLKHGNSLKWHYEVFRWFEEFVGNK